MFDVALLGATALTLSALPALAFWALLICGGALIFFWSFCDTFHNRGWLTFWLLVGLGVAIFAGIYKDPSYVEGFTWTGLLTHVLNIVSFYVVIGAVYAAIELMLWVSSEKKRFASSLENVKAEMSMAGSQLSPDAKMAVAAAGYSFPITYDQARKFYADNPSTLSGEVIQEANRLLVRDVLHSCDNEEGLLYLKADPKTYKLSADFKGVRLSGNLTGWVFGWPVYVLDLIFGRLVKRVIKSVTESIGGWLRRQGQEVIDGLFGQSA